MNHVTAFEYIQRTLPVLCAPSPAAPLTPTCGRLLSLPRMPILISRSVGYGLRGSPDWRGTKQLACNAESLFTSNLVGKF